MRFSRLTTPITINGMELRNRMVMPALHHAYTEDGFCTPRFRDHYFRRAEGGLGLIIVGSCRFDDYGSKTNSMSLATDATVPGWRVFTDGIHLRGCKVAVQLFHAGRYVPRKDVPCGGEALAPSAVYSPYTRETAPEMTRAQIRQVLQRYAAAARRALDAGFDAIEISGSSGYLLCQFLSPLTNLRGDEYGGSFENRCRFPLEVIRTVRTAVGPHVPLLYRLTGDDLVPGSSTRADVLSFVPLARRAGVDCFNVTGGWHESRVPQLTGEVPRAGLSYLARGVREASFGAPVIVCNRINDPVQGELALALGDGDLVGLGRACVADPDFAAKVTNGIPEEIRPCIACNQGCLSGAFFDRPIVCTVNPFCGRESGLPPHARAPLRVLVAGGGPAGCAAGLECARLGHTVTLMEASPRLGGQLNQVQRLPGRGEFGALISYYETALPRMGVSVLLNRAVTSDDAAGFDRLIWAAGGVPDPTQLPCTPNPVPIVTAHQILAREVIPGARVLVVGGSFVGCETARYLVREGALSPESLYYLSVYSLLPQEELARQLNGSRRTVTLVEQGQKIGFGYEPGVSWPVLQDLDRFGVTRMKLTRLTCVTDDGAVLLTPDGERTIFCDTVVLASGVHPDTDRVPVLDIPVHVVGNAARLGRCPQAIRSGADAAALL